MITTGHRGKVEKKDSKGRIIEKKEFCYDCWEGNEEYITYYDTLGKIISELTTINSERTRINFNYDLNGNLIKEKQFQWVSFNEPKDTSLLSRDSLLERELTFEYSTLNILKSFSEINYHLDDWDTLSEIKILFNENGDTLLWTEFVKRRNDFEFNNEKLSSYLSYRIYNDKIKLTTDTIRKGRIKATRKGVERY